MHVSWCQQTAGVKIVMFAPLVRYALLFAACIFVSVGNSGTASAAQKSCALNFVQNGFSDPNAPDVSPDGDGGGRPELRQGEPGLDQPSEDGTFNRLPNQPSDDDPPGCLLRERQLELIV